jgi:hypothetical protein
VELYLDAVLWSVFLTDFLGGGQVSRLNIWDKMGKVKERLAVLAELFDPSLNHKVSLAASAMSRCWLLAHVVGLGLRHVPEPRKPHNLLRRTRQRSML